MAELLLRFNGGRWVAKRKAAEVQKGGKFSADVSAQSNSAHLGHSPGWNVPEGWWGRVNSSNPKIEEGRANAITQQPPLVIASVNSNDARTHQVPTILTLEFTARAVTSPSRGFG